MKILIQNYTNSISSRPIYFNHALQSSKCAETFLWNKESISTYDVMDGFQPDVVLIKYTHLGRDLIKYVLQEKSVPIVVDITGASQEIIRNLESQIAQFNVPVKCFLTETPETLDTTTKKLKTAHVIPGADVFLSKTELPEFKLEGCVIGRIETKSFNSSCEKFKSYHKILVRDQKNQGNKTGFDIEGNIMFLKSVYDRYEEVIVNGDLNFIISQLFFDSIISCKKLSLSYPKEQRELFSDVLQSIFEDTEEDPSLENIKLQIIKNHTCIDRCSEILSAIGDSDASKTVLKLKEGL